MKAVRVARTSPAATASLSCRRQRFTIAGETQRTSTEYSEDHSSSCLNSDTGACEFPMSGHCQCRHCERPCRRKIITGGLTRDSFNGKVLFSISKDSSASRGPFSSVSRGREQVAVNLFFHSLHFATAASSQPLRFIGRLMRALRATSAPGASLAALSAY